jgi:hypothetical protein
MWSWRSAAKELELKYVLELFALRWIHGRDA